MQAAVLSFDSTAVMCPAMVAALYCRLMRIFGTWTLPFLLNAFIVLFYLVNGVGEHRLL